MSLNHRRRIFRSSFPAIRPFADLASTRRLGAALAALAVIAGGLATWRWVQAEPAAAGINPPERMVADAARVAVVDGNTLRVVDRVVRLAGVIPAERGQTCRSSDGSAFDCGVAATNALAAMLRQGAVDCTMVGTDPLGRMRASCSAGGASLNHAVVAQGWARASDDTLAEAEQTARTRQLGLWAMAR